MAAAIWSQGFYGSLDIVLAHWPFFIIFCSSWGRVYIIDYKAGPVWCILG